MRWLLLLLCVQVRAEWSFGGEALLLRPIINRSYAAAIGPNSGSSYPGSVEYVGNIKPAYDPGYRIVGSYTRSCWDAQVSWLSWIHTDHFVVSVGADKRLYLISLHHSGAGAGPFFSPGSLSRRDHFKFQVADGELGYRRGFLRSFVGLRYARIRYQAATEASGTFGTQQALVDRQQSSLQGLGPRIGVGATQALCWGLSLLGEASASCLFGTIKGDYLDFQFATTDLLAADRLTPNNLLLFNVDAFVGLGCRCLLPWLEARAGYQLSYYSEGHIWAQFFDGSQPGISEVKRDPFSFDGWAFRLMGRY